MAVSYTHLRAHETLRYLVCRLLLEKPLVGTIGEIPDWMPDRMNEVEVAADMSEDERPTIQVLKTDSPAFNNWLKTQKNEDGSFPDICEISVPTRTL